MRGDFDPEDMFVYPLFLIASLLNLGIIPDFTLWGWSALDVIWSSGPTTITWATLAGVAALVIVFATNRPSLDEWGAVQTALVLSTIALVLTPPFVPVLSEALSADIAAVSAFAVQTGGYISLSVVG